MVDGASELITPFSDNQEPLSDYIIEQDLEDEKAEFDESEIFEEAISEEDLCDLRKRKSTEK